MGGAATETIFDADVWEGSLLEGEAHVVFT